MVYHNFHLVSHGLSWNQKILKQTLVKYVKSQGIPCVSPSKWPFGDPGCRSPEFQAFNELRSALLATVSQSSCRSLARRSFQPLGIG
jgi:hypothetical protein